MDDVDVATITLLRVGGTISILSKGDGDLGELADGLVRVCSEALQAVPEAWEVLQPVTVTRDPYAGADTTKGAP